MFATAAYYLLEWPYWLPFIARFECVEFDYDVEIPLIFVVA